MLFAQITDPHVALPGTAMDAQGRTADRLALAVDHIGALDPAPDAVVCTGDLADAGSEAEYQRLVELFAPLAAPLYVIPGNHDDRDSLRRVFRGAGHDYLPERGPLCYAVDLDPLRLIALDTLIPGQPGGRIDADQLVWLDARLAEAPDRPTVIMQHHPPFRTGIALMDGMGLEAIEAEAEVVRRHPQVERILCGHLHRDITCRFAGTVATTCPSTGHQIQLDLREPGGLAITGEPPACVLHLWRDGGPLVSHVSYVDEHEVPLVLAEAGASYP
jgi:3',5'-cyclic AMP phosphodiesterase CpdA